jgi:hypothetical protein
MSAPTRESTCRNGSDSTLILAGSESCLGQVRVLLEMTLNDSMRGSKVAVVVIAALWKSSP